MFLDNLSIHANPGGGLAKLVFVKYRLVKKNTVENTRPITRIEKKEGGKEREKKELRSGKKREALGRIW